MILWMFSGMTNKVFLNDYKKISKVLTRVYRSVYNMIYISSLKNNFILANIMVAMYN